ncbi:HPr kinase/phosphorylase [Roseisalinus antarcticus]|uniref:HPr kinase/phosphorylase n=1 Tax=Roseisalinus antarcticus TaxID=254357 RepID=A0A1Y5SPJ9_9RHOB|nr:HPr kinase/phosphatase C-terminal domain-containing protein [Roseisalinus antarcticus]SLN45365.1 HPr kinase/phosphorylase [Roseisalinus antarcticus]
MPAPTTLSLHATTVAWKGRAVVLTGKSGSGKSETALMLMAWGARLVADDSTVLSRAGAGLTAACPPSIRGLIEARRVGILNAEPVAGAAVVLAVDMERVEYSRLPPRRSVSWLGVDIPLIFRVDAPHFAAAILQYLKAGRHR